MTDKVTQFTGQTFGEIPVDTVCEAAKACTDVLVIGRKHDGQLYIAASSGDVGEGLIKLELARQFLMEQVTQ